MAMRNAMIVGAIGVLAGCTKAATPPGGLTTSPPDLRCPDPSSCTRPNGTGVYTAEDGYAAIGPSQLMIMHFINHGSSVTFQDRHLEAGATLWTQLAADGLVTRADYGTQKSLDVRSVSETATVPTWTLQNRATGATVTVTGDEIQKLTLYIGFATTSFGSEAYAIDFAGPALVHPDPRGRGVSNYHMRWRHRDPPTDPVSYCHLAAAAGAPPGPDGQPPLGDYDTVVFQQGIDVEPVTGKIGRPPVAGSIVTLSCYFGAPATVYRWGYDYLTRVPFYFDAGIQMKRASYCADQEHFTKAGTPIQIADDLTAPAGNHDNIRDLLEASWSPVGAKCFNRGNARSDLARGFSGACRGSQLPTCDNVVDTSPWLHDGLVP
jgi:hypothetical protein